MHPAALAPYQGTSYLHDQLRADARSSLRWRFLVLAGFVILAVPGSTCIFRSMNVDLPLATKLILASSEVWQDWWFLALPSFVSLWISLERWILPRLSYAGIRFLARLVVVAGVGVVLALHLPMFKLCNCIG